MIKSFKDFIDEAREKQMKKDAHLHERLYADVARRFREQMAKRPYLEEFCITLFKKDLEDILGVSKYDFTSFSDYIKLMKKDDGVTAKSELVLNGGYMDLSYDYQYYFTYKYPENEVSK